jgi:hypothetical protein
VPTLADFARLQGDVYGLDPRAGSELPTILGRYYGAGFAFLVCIIDADADYAPIGYEHDHLPESALFCPTRH